MPHASKPTFTVSQIESFLRCEKEYQLHYAQGIMAVSGASRDPTSPGSLHLRAAQWGTLVHEVMQFLETPGGANAPTVIEQALTNQEIEDAQGQISAQISHLIERLLGHDEARHLLQEKARCEIPFFLDAGPCFLKGTIDRLAFLDGLWTVVDFKTDRLNREKEFSSRTKSYSIQMGFYALAVSKILQVDEVETALIFTDGITVIKHLWDKEDLRLVQEQLGATICLMQSKKNFAFPADQSICPRCPYWELNYCGVRG